MRINLTQTELALLTRLLGHHTNGRDLFLIYEKLADRCDALSIPYAGPLELAVVDNTSEYYGDRLIFKVLTAPTSGTRT